MLTDTQLSTATRLAQQSLSSSTDEFAQRLVAESLLTDYQVHVLLHRGNTPLLLDRYIVLDTLGAGGMGLVFKAFHRSMERVVALKVLPDYAVDSAEKVARFQREIRAVAKISHPNVVSAFDAHESNGTHFLVMEYVDGQNLTEVVLENGPLDPEATASVVGQMARALAAAHRQGVIHRDVKPSNIMLTQQGDAMLMDLGLSRTRESTLAATVTELTSEGLAMGTVAYMSPEQALDARDADARSDLYSLGCTAHFLLTGRPPFERETAMKTILAHREEVPPALVEGRVDVPEWFESLYQRLLAKDPDDRFQSAEELALAIESNGASSPSASSEAHVNLRQRVVSDTNGSPSKPPRMRTRWSVVAVVLVGLLLIGWLMLMITGGLRRQASRDVAKLIVAAGGSVTAETDFGEVLFVDPSEIPDSDFDIVGVDLVADSNRPLDLLKDITTLRSLSFYAVDGLDFAWLQSKQVETLTVVDCDLTDADLLQLGKIESLRILDLTDNKRVTDVGIAALGELQNLEAITLIGTQVTDQALDALCRLPRLSDVDVSETNVQLVDVPDQARQWTHLRFAACEVDDQVADQLKLWTRLELVDASESRVGDRTLKCLAQLPRLETIIVGKTKVTEAGLRELRELSSLDYLDLSYTRMDEPRTRAVASLKQLRVLDLSEARFDNRSLEMLIPLDGLQTLYLFGTDVDSAGIDRFNDARPDCDIVLEDLTDILVE